MGDGSKYGLNIQYKVQPRPEGIAQVFILAEDFLDGSDVCLILGDNIIYSDGLTDLLIKAKTIVKKEEKAIIFAYYVNDPQRYGVVTFDQEGNVISIEEKPENPKSNYAIIGLYFYPADVVELAKDIKPSQRGELEISSINQKYLEKNRLNVEVLGRGFVWFDTGTPDSLMQASNFIEAIEKRQGLKIGSIEEIAFRKKWINRNQLLDLAKPLIKSDYGKYLIRRVRN